MKAKKYVTEQPIDNCGDRKKTPRDKWKQKHNDLKPMRYSKSSSNREVYSNTTLPQETRRITNKQLDFTHKTIRGRGTNKTQS